VAAGARAFLRGVEARDWDALRALYSPDLVVQDHRPLGWETLHGPEQYVKTLESLVELAPDVRLRQDHTSVSDGAALFVNAWVGTRDGGAFEAPRIVVWGFDAGGLMYSMDIYNVDQLDAARARFEELGPDPAHKLTG
jgi:ketosteroid isomerase-like protein